MSLWFPFRTLFRPRLTRDAWPPPTLAEAGEEEPVRHLAATASPVHIMAGSALARVKDGTLVVERPDEPDYERPIELVSALHVHGWGGVTSPCIGALISQGTPVLWRGPNGYPIGITAPMHRAGLDIRRAQYANADGPRGLSIARALVGAKITSMRGLVRRRAPLADREGLEGMQHLARRALEARSIESLIGIEGAATASYFGVWPALLTARAGEAEFDGRSRRPPRDEVNTFLSYAYALVAGECLSAVAATGLDPRLGVMHQPRAGRPALALDLMEPFRPLIADQAILTGLNTGQVSEAHTETRDGGVHLTEAGKRLAIDLVERRMTQALTWPGRAEQVSYREAIGLQARALAGALAKDGALSVLERP